MKTVLLCLAACACSSGERGATGAGGPPGPRGEQGAQGEPGNDGADAAALVVVSAAGDVLGPATYSDDGVVMYSPRAGCFIVLSASVNGNLSYVQSQVRAEYSTTDCTGSPQLVMATAPAAWAVRCYAASGRLYVATSATESAVRSSQSRWNGSSCDSGFASDSRMWFPAREVTTDTLFPYASPMLLSFE